MVDYQNTNDNFEFAEDFDDDTDSGTGGASGGGTDRKPFTARGYLVQAELAKGEQTFGEIDWGRRETEPPPEETQSANYSEEAGLAAANDDVLQSHPYLASQQFDGRDPKRDQRIPSAEDIEKATNDPKLVLSPELRLALENAQRHKANATPTPKPSGL